MMTSTSATDALSLPISDLIDFYETIALVVEDVKKLREDGGEER
ncbi:hypothetical protein [Hydrogenoanaerobacterium saccharovorans]|nr:hypothetical protein [Hydrogenoanaerobacterium saccharovorans]